LQAPSSLVSVFAFNLLLIMTDNCPGDSKSTTQKLSDITSSNADSAEGAGKTYVDQAKDLANQAVDAAKPYIDSAQKTAQPYIDSASKAVSDLVSGEKK
jgi:hypothetical protein